MRSKKKSGRSAAKVNRRRPTASRAAEKAQKRGSSGSHRSTGGNSPAGGRVARGASGADRKSRSGSSRNSRRAADQVVSSVDEHSMQLLFPEISDRERKGKWWAARLLWLRGLYIGRKIQSLGMDSSIISYEGQRFRIYAGGEGNQPLVLLHGFLDTSHVFRRVLPELLKRFRVYMLDLPGHGESEMPFIRSLWHLPDISASIFRLLHHRLRLQDPILLSHSMGGLVGIHAQFFARKYHDLTLFQSMHLIAPGALLLSPEEREVLRRRFFPGTREEVQELFNHLFYSQIPELPGWAISGLLYEWSGPGFQYLAANTLERESEVFYKPTDLKKLDVPVELYWGKEDSITPLQLGKKLQKSIRGSKLHQFSPAGHGLLQEKPGEFLDRFLSRIDEL